MPTAVPLPSAAHGIPSAHGAMSSEQAMTVEQSQSPSWIRAHLVPFIAACMAAILVIVGGVYTAFEKIPGTNIGAWARPKNGSISGSGNGVAKLADARASFANGYKKAWSTAMSESTSQGDTYGGSEAHLISVPGIQVMAATDSVWVVLVSSPDHGSHLVGLDAHTGKQLWSGDESRETQCSSTLLEERLVCGRDNQSSLERIELIDISDGRITQTIKSDDIVSDSKHGLLVRTVYEDSVILEETGIDNGTSVGSRARMIAVNAQGDVKWQSKMFDVPSGDMGSAFAGHTRIVDGLAIFADLGGAVMPINLDNGEIVSAAALELFGSTLVTQFTEGRANVGAMLQSGSTFTLPSGSEGTILQGHPVTFATGAEVPNHPILQTNANDDPLGYTTPTVITSPEHDWSLDTADSDSPLRTPSDSNTFWGAYAKGELILLDDSGHLCRVDDKTGTVLWSASYDGYRHEQYGLHWPRSMVLNDGTVLVEDYSDSNSTADEKTGRFLVAFSGETGQQLWRVDGASPLLTTLFNSLSHSDTAAVVSGMNTAIPMVSATDSQWTISRLDPVPPQARVNGMPQEIASCPAGWTPLSWSTWTGDTPGHTLVCNAPGKTTYYVLVSIDGKEHKTTKAKLGPTGCYAADFGKSGNHAQICFDGGATWLTKASTTTAYFADKAWYANRSSGFTTVPQSADDIPSCPAGSYPMTLSIWESQLLLTCGKSSGSVTNFYYYDGSKTSHGTSMSEQGEGKLCGTDESGRMLCQSSAVVSVENNGSTTNYPTQSSYTLQAGQSNTLNAGKAETLDSAQAKLDAEVAQDRSLVESNLVGSWTPQLSAKYIGFDDGEGTVYDAQTLWNHFQGFKDKYPTALLLKGREWSSFGFNTTPNLSMYDWYTIESGITFSDPNEANRWCANEGFEPKNCFAVQISHGEPIHTSLMWQEGDF
jgi:hypothetical protein